MESENASYESILAENFELKQENQRLQSCMAEYEDKIADLEAELRHVKGASVESQGLYVHFAGEWEIRSGREKAVWGKAAISTEGAFFKPAGKPNTYPISFEGNLAGEVQLRSAISDACLDLQLSDVIAGQLSWRIMRAGKPSGLAQWSRVKTHSAASVQRSTPKRASVKPRKRSVDKTFEVAEIISEEQKNHAIRLHNSKAAFVHDQKWLNLRIFNNEDGSVHCRSWLLMLGEIIVAAATVRLIPYMNREGFAWAQIMNVSVDREREGYGTRLVAGLEELLWREHVDVIVLYPVPNNRADKFWASMGYAESVESLLPSEELDPKNNALIPEGWEQKGVRTVLPRWEKKLVRDYPHPAFREGARKRRRIQLEMGDHHIDTHDETTWKTLRRVDWPLWRKAEAEHSRIGGDDLSAQFQSAIQSRQVLKDREQEQLAQRALKGNPSATTNSENSESSRTSVATTNVRV